MNLTPIIKDSFLQFGGAVLQSRALPDARDLMKPSARQIFYCLYTDGFVHEKPFQKTLKAIGSCFRMYIHGDSSAEGVIMRAGQPFAMRYPLIEVEGSYGTLLASGSWSAPRYCLTGDALVSTDKGLIRIEDIVSSEKNTDNEIPTLTCRGAFGLTTTNLIFNSGLQQTYKLTLKNGIQINGTPNHPILTLNDKFEFIWKTIEELNEGDKILLNVRNNFLYGQENDIEYAKALGCLVSEGCLTTKNKIDMINSDLDMIEPVQNLLQKYGSKATFHKRNQKDNCYQISTTNQILYQKLEEDNCIYNSYHKHIPDSVFRGTREYQKEFLKYLFEGDGCVTVHSNRYGTIAYSSVSEDLIKELQLLLLSNFGIVSYITRQKNRKEIKLEIGGEDAYLFCKNIGFVSNRKNEKAKQTVAIYEENRDKKSTGSRGWRVFPEIKDFLTKYYPETKLIINRKNRPSECKGPLMSKDGLKILKEKLPYETFSKIEFIYRNFVFIPIIKKEDIGLQIVYSPKINEDCHSFMANGVINHNTSSRLSPLSNYLFADIKKDVIDEWRDNYDDTEQCPMTLPSKGFYNIVNGTYGIGVGASCSIPQYNLKEVNEALIKLLWNKDIDFDEIFCVPDFATGAILLNEKEIKESHENGRGAACKLRSVVEFDDKDRCFVVKEIPYMVYTETICSQLEEIINDDGKNPGIERFNDLTGKEPLIKIYLKKNANPNKVLKFLYKNTSLQTHYGINFTVLENGRFPKVYNWKQLLQAHLDHECQVYIRGYQYDINKLNARLHIIEGLLIAMASINEVVQTIKSSSTTSEALTNLTKNFNLDEGQAKAILDMKLARLAHLEVSKLEKEKSEKETERNRIQAILDDENLLKKEIEKGLREVMEKFGDARRTKVLNLETSEDEPIEIKQLQISLTNKNNLYVNEASSLYTQRRGGVGAKLKVKEGEYVLSSRPIESNEEILLFSQNGNFYPIAAQDIPRGEIVPIEMLAPLKSDEKIKALTSLNKKQIKPYIIFITKNGFIKKSNIEEYNIKRKTGTKAITLEDGDEIINIVFTNKEKLGLLSTDGNFILVETDDIRPIGRVSKGIKGMKLNDGESVISAHLIPEKTSYLISISGEGLFKRTPFSEFNVQGKNTKGAKIQKLNDDDWMADFLPMTDEKDVLISSTRSSIKLNINDVPVFSKGALGNKSIKLNASDNVVGIS